MFHFFTSFSLFFLISVTSGTYAGNLHLSEAHIHKKLVDGQNLQIAAGELDKFVKGLSKSQIAIVSVKGMVCDFCARGIEKTFRKDKALRKIDVDLNQGKVLLAYSMNKEIVPGEINHSILVNGQNMTGLQVITTD